MFMYFSCPINRLLNYRFWFFECIDYMAANYERFPEATTKIILCIFIKLMEKWT
jgi:hypothetical protein